MKTTLTVVACALLVIASSGCSARSAARARQSSQSEVVYTQAATPTLESSSGGAPVVNDSTFESEVMGAKIALVDFNARWCGPCRRMGPVIDALASEMAGEAKVVKLDIDESTKTADKYDVHSIPCLIVFKDGTEIERHYGIHSREELKAWMAAGDKSVSLAQ